MEPPKFRHKKVPRGTGSPPVPVMHSPPRPVTVKDQQVLDSMPDSVHDDGESRPLLCTADCKPEGVRWDPQCPM